MPVTVENSTTEKNAPPKSEATKRSEPARYHVRLVHPASYMFRNVLVRRGDVIEVSGRDRNYLTIDRGNFEDYAGPATPGRPVKVEPGEPNVVEVIQRRRAASADDDNEPLPDMPRRAKGARRVAQRRKSQRARRTSGIGSRMANETTVPRSGHLEVE